MGAGCASAKSVVHADPDQAVAEKPHSPQKTGKPTADQCADDSCVLVAPSEQPSTKIVFTEAWSQESTRSGSEPSDLDMATNQASSSPESSSSTKTLSVEVIGPADTSDDLERKVCWIRDSFHIRDPDPIIRRKRPALKLTRSLSISSGKSDEECSSTDLFARATKSKISPSYVGQMETGSVYFLSQANDVNSATLKRLDTSPCSPTAAARFPEDVRTLVVIDWDDTLFPTSWSHRAFPEDEEYRETARAAANLLAAARQVGDVLVVTLAAEHWVLDCIERAGDAELTAEMERANVVYSRNIQEAIEVWPRLNEPPRAARNFGVLLESKTWELELRAQLINSKMASVRSAMPEGCRQVISIGDSEIERWAVHDLPFASEELAGVLVKTIKFQEELSNDALRDMLQTTAGLLGQFARLNVEMDVDLRAGDSFFPMDLQFAMQTASRPQDDFDCPSPKSPVPFGRRSSVKSNRTSSWRSHEL